MITINIFSDFACPWCYIGEKRLQDAIKLSGLEGEVFLAYRAFELNPGAPKESSGNTVDRLAAKYNLSLDKAKRKVEQVDRAGKESGIDFNFGSVKQASTFDAHRLMKLAEHSYGQEVTEKLNMALFDANFTKNLSLSDPTVLTEIGVNAGIDENDITNLLNSDQFKEEVINDENIARNLGITGVPYFIIDGKVAIPGAISKEDFVDALKNISAANEKGSSCGCSDSGCSI